MDFFILIFYNEYFKNGLFYKALFYKHFFILTTRKKLVEIEITINICWLCIGPPMLGNGLHGLGNGPHVLGNVPHCEVMDHMC